MQEPPGDADAHRYCDSGPASYADAGCYAVHATSALSNRDAHAAYSNGRSDPNAAPYCHADTTPDPDTHASRSHCPPNAHGERTHADPALTLRPAMERPLDRVLG